MVKPFRLRKLLRPGTLHLIRIFIDRDGPSSVRSAMFIVSPTLAARPSSVRSGMNGILRPTARQCWGRQREAMPLRWSLAAPVASVAIDMALQKELFASSRLPRRHVKDTYKVPRPQCVRGGRGGERRTALEPENTGSGGANGIAGASYVLEASLSWVEYHARV